MYLYFLLVGVISLKCFGECSTLSNPTRNPLLPRLLSHMCVLFKEALMISLFSQYMLFSVMLISVQRPFYDDS